VTMEIQKGFQAYQSGVYVDDGTARIGLHAVKLVGYGTTGATEDPPSTPYWNVANSWSETWGEKGYFRIRRGSNDCGVELGAADGGCPIAGVPLIPTPSPPPAPTPPASYHYGQPPCRSDEVNTQVRGGTVCAKECKSDADCPTDVPPGISIKPKCTTDDEEHSPICALVCDLHDPEGPGCPAGSTCIRGNPVHGDQPGLCTWLQMGTIAV